MGIRGIGGIFFKAKAPKELADWYEKHLGVFRDDDGYTIFGWREIDRPNHVGQTVWSPFPDDTGYFDPSDSTWMVNYRVDDLDAELKRLEDEGVTLVGEPQSFDYGKFAWGLDCEGNKFELWEPPPVRPFPVTVPATDVTDAPGTWLCDPGRSIAVCGAQMSREMIVRTRVVPIARSEVWRLWTTSEGVSQWLADANVELRIGGPFEIEFESELPEGERGSEGCKILSFLPERMLSFTWNAPQHLDYTRLRHTHVVVEFDDVEEGTSVRVTHLGWPTRKTDPNPQWAATFAFFEHGWERVLDAFEHRANR